MYALRNRSFFLWTYPRHVLLLFEKLRTWRKPCALDVNHVPMPIDLDYVDYEVRCEASLLTERYAPPPDYIFERCPPEAIRWPNMCPGPIKPKDQKEAL
jgi:hypothetical protein